MNNTSITSHFILAKSMFSKALIYNRGYYEVENPVIDHLSANK